MQTFRLAPDVPADLAPALKILAASHAGLAGGKDAAPLAFETLPAPAAPAAARREGAGWRVLYARPCDALRLVGRLLAGEKPAAPERNPFERFGVMIDLSRNAVFTVPYAKRVLEKLALLGYNYAMLYTEDTYELPGEPYFGMLRGRLAAADVRAIDAHAAALGLELVPCIETLGHNEQLFRWNAYEEVRDIDGILLAWEEKTYRLIEKEVRFWRDNTRSRVVHLGMDEAWRLGEGRFKERFGEKKVFDIMTRHLDRVMEGCRKLGVTAIMWSDMWFRAGSAKHDYYDLDAKVPPAVAKKIPADVRQCYWDYYHDTAAFYEKMIDKHRALHGEPVVASGIWTWNMFWYGHRLTRNAAGRCIEACRSKGVGDLLFTMWGDDGGFCDFESAFAGLAWCAEKAFSGGDPSPALLEKRYAALFEGASYKAVTALGEWSDSGLPQFLWDDPLMNLRHAQLRAEGDWEVHLADRAKPQHHRDLVPGLRAAARALARATPTPNGEGGSIRFARAFVAALLARADLADALLDAWKLPRARRRAAVRIKALPAAGSSARTLETFAAEFRTMWLSHNRPQGMETTQIRLAGAVERAHEAVLRLEEYAVGTAETIPELDDLEKVGFQPAFRDRSWGRLAHGTVIA